MATMDVNRVARCVLDRPGWNRIEVSLEQLAEGKALGNLDGRRDLACGKQKGMDIGIVGATTPG